MLKIAFLCLVYITFTFPALSEESSPPEQTNSANTDNPDAAQFVKLRPMLISVIQNRELVGAYVMQLVIESPSVAAADDIRKIQPTVRDALLTDIYSIFSLVWDRDTRIHLPDFKVRLLSVAQKAGGKNRIKSVLIQSFQEQFSNRHRGHDYRH